MSVDIRVPGGVVRGRDEGGIAVFRGIPFASLPVRGALRWIAAFERALASSELAVPQQIDLSPPLWELGHLGWFQERWIARHVLHQQGPAADGQAARLACTASGTRVDFFSARL